MKYFTLWASLTLILFFSGCSVKEYQISEAKIITFKTPKLRFNDLGYIRQSDDAIQVELFSAGQAVERFEINHLVCITKGCMSKHAFNEEYFIAAYPDDLLQNILLGRKIFDGKETEQKEGGFDQYLQGETYDIIYRVNSEQTFFRDRANNILIRIRSVKK